MFKNFNEKNSKNFDAEFANLNVNLGLSISANKFVIKLWQPLAKEVDLLLFAKQDNFKNVVKTIKMKKKDNVWQTKIAIDYEGYAYQFKILHQDQKITYALDPYAKSMAPFNWKKEELGKAILINLKSKQNGIKPTKLKTKFNNSVDPVIYELQIRDFTSLFNQKLINRKGTFLAAMEANIFEYVKKMGITHIQILPIQSTFSIDETKLKILKKGQGEGWFTNYNWGYDPHNYFTINGWYSSDPSDPYARNREFKEFVNQAHQHGIGIIVDVVYNHLMSNDIFDKILPKYYFRQSKPYPVSSPPLASERVMVRKLIIDSLIYFVKDFNVDGFRFDLSCFMDKQTLEQLAIELRKINPNIVLHGEAWPWSNLDFQDSYIKGVNTNELNFAYFNDTTRDAIKGKDDYNKLIKGLAHGNEENFAAYVNAIVGNLKNYQYPQNIVHSKSTYDNFAISPGMNLQYISCHDNFTLWDKINFSSRKKFIVKIEQYRQALMLQFTTQGRQLILAGTELLQSKPLDISGEEAHKSYGFKTLEDIFDYRPDKNAYHENSYKTTDYVNGIKWKNLNHKPVQQVQQFLSGLINFRQNTDFFRLDTSQKINQSIEFIQADNSIIIFQIVVNKQKVMVIHNLSKNKFEYNIGDLAILFQSKIAPAKLQASQLTIEANCSYILGRK